MTNDATPGNVPLSDQLGRLPTVARLYYTGRGSRRYKRASVHNGPGEALTFVSLAEERVRQAVALECERLRAELERLRAENAALKRDLQYARDGLTKGRTRMREDNERLAREAHTWWTAARDATKAERERCAIRVATHSQYPITTDFDRGYDKARKDAAETLRKMGDDAGLELGPNVELTGAAPMQESAQTQPGVRSNDR